MGKTVSENREFSLLLSAAYDPRRITEVSGCVRNVDEFGACSEPVLSTAQSIMLKATTKRCKSFGAVAQLVERFHGMEEARGSIPLSSTLGYADNLMG